MQCRRAWFDPWVRKFPWKREWQPTPVFLPGEFQGQRSLEGYSPWGHKESDMTERLTLSLFLKWRAVLWDWALNLWQLIIVSVRIELNCRMLSWYMRILRWYKGKPHKVRILGLPWWLSGKESACRAGDTRDTGSIPGREDPPEGHMATHGQRSLVGYSS